MGDKSLLPGPAQLLASRRLPRREAGSAKGAGSLDLVVDLLTGNPSGAAPVSHKPGDAQSLAWLWKASP